MEGEQLSQLPQPWPVAREVEQPQPVSSSLHSSLSLLSQQLEASQARVHPNQLLNSLLSRLAALQQQAQERSRRPKQHRTRPVRKPKSRLRSPPRRSRLE